mmetsp:Transcript_18789/g.37424  ORF Transcript_18789/g.37424 Transcript_18789/m.37424 type:complete len:122 (+) Transcript_18789:75-440(+)
MKFLAVAMHLLLTGAFFSLATSAKELKMGAPNQPFLLVTGATCPDSYRPLTSSWVDCRDAAISLGFTGDTINHVDYKYPWGTGRPQGCFQSTGNNRFRFNTGAGGGYSGNDKILCMPEPKE